MTSLKCYNDVNTHIMFASCFFNTVTDRQTKQANINVVVVGGGVSIGGLLSEKIVFIESVIIFW